MLSNDGVLMIFIKEMAGSLKSRQHKSYSMLNLLLQKLWAKMSTTRKILIYILPPSYINDSLSKYGYKQVVGDRQYVGKPQNIHS